MLAIKSRAIYIGQIRRGLPDMEKWFEGRELNFEEFLCFSLYSTNHAMNRVYTPVLKELGLTYPQYLVMLALWKKDGQLVGELGQKMHLESSTLTPLLKRLEKLNFVRRQRDAEDERKVRVTLTSEGHALHEQAACVPGQILEAIGMTPEEIIALSAQINKVRKNLESWSLDTTE